MICPICKESIDRLDCTKMTTTKFDMRFDEKSNTIIEEQKSIIVRYDKYSCPKCEGMIAEGSHNAEIFIISDALKETMCPFCFAKDKTKHFEFDIEIKPPLPRQGIYNWNPYYVATCTRCGGVVVAMEVCNVGNGKRK